LGNQSQKRWDSRQESSEKDKGGKLGKGAKVGLAVLFLLGILVGGFFLIPPAQSNSELRLKAHPFGKSGDLTYGRGVEFSGRSEMVGLSIAHRIQAMAAESLLTVGLPDSAASRLKGLPESPYLSGLRVLAAWGWKGPLETAIPFPEPGSAEAALGGTLLEGALKSNPQNPWLLYLSGRLKESRGEEDAALTAYGLALKASPQFAFPASAKARLMEKRGARTAASLFYREAASLLETEPEGYGARGGSIPWVEPSPYGGLARLFLYKGEFDSAGMVLDYGQGKGRKDPGMEYAEAEVKEARGRLASAESLYAVLVTRFPRHSEFAQGLLTLGKKAHLANPETKGSEAIFAISVLEPLVAQFPKDAALHMALGQAYNRRGLFALATAAFDSVQALNPNLIEARDWRATAYNSWKAESRSRQISRTDSGGTQAVSGKVQIPLLTAAPLPQEVPSEPEDEDLEVVVPGSIALLGSYMVAWGASQGEVRRNYPDKKFSTVGETDMTETFGWKGARHDYRLRFREGSLAAVTLSVTDTAGRRGDLFGRLIQLKAKISGEGKGTGETSCPGIPTFQAAIWENDDTFEFMAQYLDKPREVHAIRWGRHSLPENRRLCELAGWLKESRWK
jgi:tetratricopeptide (TPR) repeat protein